MAKKKEEKSNTPIGKDLDKAFDVLFKTVDKTNEYATTLEDDSIADIKHWLHTGFYSLNAIIGADLYRGIPCGRITTLFGPSQSGKSLISACVQKAAQDSGMRVVIFDSEFDKDGRMEKSFGVDTSLVKTLPVETIEDVITQADKIFNSVMEQSLEGKVLFILDSLGALSTRKEIDDLNNGKVAQDMGLKAKLVKTFFRTMKGKTALSKCPFLIINHEIANPNQMYDSIFKQQGGGQAIEFFSSTMIHVGKTKMKQDVKDDFDESSILTKKDFSGQSLNLFTQKNRCAVPHQQVECYLNYKNGIDPYSGLKPFLDNMDNLYLKSAQGEIGKGRTFYIKTTNAEGVEEEIKLGEWKEWKNKPEVWDIILPELNKIVKKELTLGADV
jgi:RecA/RadA recombinase